ncbi:hypothetical protein RhiirA4_394386, partial [Rhizophagus irregularis]
MRNIISCTTRPKIRNLSPRSKIKYLNSVFHETIRFLPKNFSAYIVSFMIYVMISIPK